MNRNRRGLLSIYAECISSNERFIYKSIKISTKYRPNVLIYKRYKNDHPVKREKYVQYSPLANIVVMYKIQSLQDTYTRYITTWIP